MAIPKRFTLPMENDLNPVTCPICYEEYGDSEGGRPIILITCGHSVCKSCIIQIGLCSAANGQISCPKCRAVSQFIDGMVVNFSLLQVAVDGRRNTNPGKECSSHPNKSCCAFCFECDRWFCPECLVLQGAVAMRQATKQDGMAPEEHLEDVMLAQDYHGTGMQYHISHLTSHTTVSVSELGSRIEEIRKELDNEAKALHDILLDKVEASYSNLQARIAEVQRVEKKYNPSCEEQIECLKAAQKLEELVHLGGHMVQKTDFFLPTDCSYKSLPPFKEEAGILDNINGEWAEIKQIVKRKLHDVHEATQEGANVDLEAAANVLLADLKRELLCESCLGTEPIQHIDL